MIINAAFEHARGVRPGYTIGVILFGRLQAFRVAVMALSPEFVFAKRSALPSPADRNFVVLWTRIDAVASAIDMIGALNELAMKIAPGKSKGAIIVDVDRILAQFGSRGAHDLRDLPSNRFLEDELVEQETMAIVMPAIFFGITAFLFNIALGRMIKVQGEQIA